MNPEETLIAEETATKYPTHFKVVSEGRSNMYKIGPRRGPSGRITEAVPEALKDQLFYSQHSVNASLAYNAQKEYIPSAGQMIMSDEAVPQLAAYTPDGTPRRYKTVDFDFHIANQRSGVNMTHEEFIIGINYLFDYLTVECRSVDTFYLFYYDETNRLVRMIKQFEITKTKKGKK
jgi:hypothetical protein